MKKSIFVFILGLILASAALTCAEEQVGYDYLSRYPGLFIAERLYQLDQKQALWLGSRRPKFVHELRCEELLNALRHRGTWTGNMTDRGECLGYNEASTWSTGNYLNYLNRAAQGQKDKP